ncbi:transposase [Streptomyces griseus]|uniref:transposase n=1 Tax=Streptomyces griseus TaxID=1911 RepID=UPI0037D49FC9
MLPPARVRPKGGRRVRHPRRRIVDEVFYVVRTGCAWRQLPKDFAPWPTVRRRHGRADPRRTQAPGPSSRWPQRRAQLWRQTTRPARLTRRP